MFALIFVAVTIFQEGYYHHWHWTNRHILHVGPLY